MRDDGEVKLTAVVFSMIAIVTLILVIALNNRETKQNNHSKVSQYTQNQVVTLFMHGYGGSENSENLWLIKQLKRCY